MSLVGRLDGWTVAALLLGAVLLSASAAEFPHVNRTEHYTMVSPLDAANVSDPGDVRDFEGLSSEAKAVFLEARNASGTVETLYTPAERPEFGYYDDTGAIDYVRYEGAYYEVVTSRADCLGLLCYLPHLRLGAIAVAGAALVGYGLWRGIRVR